MNMKLENNSNNHGQGGKILNFNPKGSNDIELPPVSSKVREVSFTPARPDFHIPKISDDSDDQYLHASPEVGKVIPFRRNPESVATDPVPITKPGQEIDSELIVMWEFVNATLASLKNWRGTTTDLKLKTQVDSLLNQLAGAEQAYAILIESKSSLDDTEFVTQEAEVKRLYQELITFIEEDIKVSFNQYKSTLQNQQSPGVPKRQ